ncbi:hypothetical protein [Pseudomonas sp. SCB32]|uniref:hypothetical protein n=1 Tax=Pseudomonas sp. SCB32 TaxID=2653853 RepID=UPI0012650DFE|nr:hypothetical protein [Pseudomonas sp. SCB32]
MATANDTSHPAITERATTHGFIPLATTSQHSYFPREAMLYLRADAPADALYDAADNRLGAVIDLLAVLEMINQDDMPIRNVFRISRALLLLVSDAQSLYQADHEQRRKQ